MIFTGLPGDTGEAGVPGLQGEKGIKGMIGEPGFSQFPPGTKGDFGEPGFNGLRGRPGDRGEDGFVGFIGRKVRISWKVTFSCLFLQEEIHFVLCMRCNPIPKHSHDLYIHMFLS